MLADISKLSSNFKSDSNEYKDSKFVKYLIKDKVKKFILKAIAQSQLLICYFYVTCMDHM